MRRTLACAALGAFISGLVTAGLVAMRRWPGSGRAIFWSEDPEIWNEQVSFVVLVGIAPLVIYAIVRLLDIPRRGRPQASFLKERLPDEARDLMNKL